MWISSELTEPFEPTASNFKLPFALQKARESGGGLLSRALLCPALTFTSQSKGIVRFSQIGPTCCARSFKIP